MPMIETEIADAVKEGTSQTINWKLFPSDELSVKKIIAEDLQNREEGVNIDGINGPNLLISHFRFSLELLKILPS